MQINNSFNLNKTEPDGLVEPPLKQDFAKGACSTIEKTGGSVTIIPGLYFKTHSRYTESRIPFEIFGVISMVESEGYYCNVIDFNIKSTNDKFPKGQIIFPNLDFNENFYFDAAKHVVSTSSNLYLFMVSIHTNGNMYHSLKIAQFVKEIHPKAIVAFAGLGPSSRAEDVLKRFHYIDFVVIGEAEATIAEILKKMRSKDERFELTKNDLSSINGINFLDRAGELVTPGNRELIFDLDNLPFPSFEYYGSTIKMLTSFTSKIDYLSVEENVHLEAGRGCPFDCTFCSNGYLWKRRYRLKSEKRIIEEIKACQNAYGGKKFLLHQQLFTANKKKTLSFCNELIQAGINVEWSCFTRNDCINEELLVTMKSSGCNTIMFGIESGSQRIQDMIDKKMHINKIKEQIELTRKCGIKPQLSFIIGFPFETNEDLQMTIDMYFEYKFKENVESQIGLLAPAGGIKLLDAYKDSLRFDGIQTTTWYTRFFSEQSYEEIQGLSQVVPQNFYFETPFIERRLLKFIKNLDIASSYLRETLKTVYLNYNLNFPFEIFQLYETWRNSQNDFLARNYFGELFWHTDEESILVEFFQFFKEQVIPIKQDYIFLQDLISYELHKSLINLSLRERFYSKTCCSALPYYVDSDNFIKDPYKKTELKTSYNIDEVMQKIDCQNNLSINRSINPCLYVFQAMNETEFSVKAIIENYSEIKIHNVFRQVEF